MAWILVLPLAAEVVFAAETVIVKVVGVVIVLVRVVVSVPAVVIVVVSVHVSEVVRAAVIACLCSSGCVSGRRLASIHLHEGPLRP